MCHPVIQALKFSEVTNVSDVPNILVCGLRHFIKI